MGKGADPNCGTALKAPTTKRRGQARTERAKLSGFATPEKMIDFARAALERTGVEEGDFFLLDLFGSGLETEEAREAFFSAAYEMGVDLHIFDHEDTLSAEELEHRAYLTELAAKGAGTYLQLSSFGWRDAAPDPHPDTRDKSEERKALVRAFGAAKARGKASGSLRESQIVWPTATWASRVYPGLSPEDAQARLADCLTRATFADDPEARAKHTTALRERAKDLNDFAVDEIEITNPPDTEGPFKDHPYNRGTNLVIGMAQDQKFATCDTENSAGDRMAFNNPSDEVFGTPSSKRVSGHMTTTRPAVIKDPLTQEEVIIDGIYMEFEEGQMTCIKALNPEQQEAVERIFSEEMMTHAISEVGIVSSDGALAQETHNGKPVNFYHVICDENAGFHLGFGASHIAFTGGIPASQGGDAGEPILSQKVEAFGYEMNQPHHDLVIGGSETRVRVRNQDGEEKEIIRGSWLDGRGAFRKERQENKRCQGETREGNPCKKNALQDQDYCAHHI